MGTRADLLEKVTQGKAYVHKAKGPIEGSQSMQTALFPSIQVQCVFVNEIWKKSQQSVLGEQLCLK